jgi:hypothetical protein
MVLVIKDLSVIRGKITYYDLPIRLIQQVDVQFIDILKQCLFLHQITVTLLV